MIVIKYITDKISLYKQRKKDKNVRNVTLFEQWQFARNQFQYYALRAIYDKGDNFRRTVSNAERQYCIEMANKWDVIINELTLKIRHGKA